MITSLPYNLLICAVVSSLFTALDHQKSFLLVDSAAIVQSIAIYKNSLLLTSSNDIVQKDIETGSILRTFRGHTNQIWSFVITENDRMITSAFDDMIIVWDLLTASILDRIWLRAQMTLVTSLVHQNNFAYAGGNDKSVRQIDLVSGRITKTIDIVAEVNKLLVDGDFLYVGKSSAVVRLDKVQISTSSVYLTFDGHTDAVFALYLHGTLLFSGSGDRRVICWNSITAEQIKIFEGHTLGVYSVAVFNDELYSGGIDQKIIQWNIDDGQIIKTFKAVHDNLIRCMADSGETIFTGSSDASVIRWNVTTGLPLFSYKGRVSILRDTVSWKNLIISGGDDGQVRIWDTSFDSLEPLETMHGHLVSVTCLYVHKDTLFSGSPDTSIRHWNLTSFSLLQILRGHVRTVSSLVVGDSSLYSSGYDFLILRWNISSGSQISGYAGHTDRISCIQYGGGFVFSGSEDKTIKVWNTETRLTELSFSAAQKVIVILLVESSIIAGFDSSLLKIDASSGETLVYLPENSGVSCLVFNGLRVFSGHRDSVIRSRDLDSLTVLETYSGHQSSVTSLSLNAYGILFSSSGDGSVKKWNLASRKVAFSFENRNSSVTALAISDDLLVVGLKNGIINYFSIDNAILANTSSFHKKSITSLVSYDGEVYSSSLDGFIFKQSTRLRIARNLHINAEQRDVRSLMIFKSQLFAIRGASEIFSFQIDRNGVVNTLINSTEPLLCIEVSDTLFIAGAKSGLILVWELETLTFRYYLRGHTSQVNSLLVHDDFLFSASSDKTIIKWSLEKRIIDLVLKRFSASALGHLGPVNYLAFCHGALFSAGADTAVRRWNVENGKHHDVYFGFSKSVTTVLCFNKSVIAGSEDSSVLLFRPIFAEETISTSTSLKSQRQTKPGKIIRKVQQNLDGGTMSPLNQTYLIIGAAVLLLVILALTTIIKWRSLRREKASPVIEDSSKSSTLYPTDLKTVVNSVMGISKHAAYLIDNAAVVKVKKIATGEAELKKAGDTVILKEVFVKGKASEDVFYQEVGIMVMLSTFPNFCEIVGYTENPMALVLKNYPNGSLNSWLKENIWGTGVMIKILKEISEALNTMHSHYLAHCDVKPQNVLVEVANVIPTCFITDFGITQILSENIVASRSFRIISLKGLSVNYASPESLKCFRLKNYSGSDFKKYDVYSLSCITYELLSRRTPWS